MKLLEDSEVVGFLEALNIRVEHANPDRDSFWIANLIDICRQERRTVLNHFTEKEEREYIEHLGSREAVFVAWVDERFAGFAGIAPRWGFSERHQHCGEAGTWVMPDLRGRGVGTALWREGVLPWCLRVGFRHVGFQVMAQNLDSVAFYEKMGFRVCGYHRRIVNWDGELLDSIEMEIWLRDQ